LDPQTFALSEPHYWQQNVSYLLLGRRTAILFDTGPGVYSIREQVANLTSLPILVIPSHLHFDHVGRIQEFPHVALLDRPELKAQVRDGEFIETSPQYMLEDPIRFRVDRWISDGGAVDLGGRTITVINTPGHTPESITLIDLSHKRAYTGDLINRLVTLSDVPGSDVKKTEDSLRHLLRLMPAGSRAFEAHSEQPLELTELRLLLQGITRIASGTAVSKPMCLGGQPMLRYDVGAFPIVLPPDSNERLQPLKSVTETLEWEGGPCADKK
jgi:glyoxylase-like metal-dependent hydrolase (beta-lactamase superfamily II)